jgi:hypothetical protein
MAAAYEEGEVEDGRRRRALSAALRPFPLVLIVLASLQPFVAFLAANRDQLDSPVRVVGYGLVVAAIAVGAYLAVCALFPSLSPAGVGVGAAVVVTTFFAVSHVADPVLAADRWAANLAMWALLTGALVFLGYRLAAFDSMRVALVIFAAVFLAVPVVTLATEGWGSSEAAADQESPIAGKVPAIEGEPPNVYWFVFDAYGRNDKLAEHVDFDNDGFTTELEDLGFTVSTSTDAAYPRTHVSIGSTLQMDYAALPGNDIDDQYGWFGPIVRGDNAVVRRFREHGYSYVYSPYAGLEWAQCDDDLVDACLDAQRPDRALDELDRALVNLTPVAWFDLFGVPYTDPVHVVDGLDAADVDEPFFLFAHVASPHRPYRFDEACDLRSRPLSIEGIDDETWKAAVRNEITCLNELILAGVEQILAEDPDAIIILQSDHGTDFSVNWDAPPAEWTDEALDERFASLNAILLPESCQDLPVEGGSLVNTFRLVFSCIEGEPIEMLEPRRFVSSWFEVDDVAEVAPP